MRKLTNILLFAMLSCIGFSSCDKMELVYPDYKEVTEYVKNDSGDIDTVTKTVAIIKRNVTRFTFESKGKLPQTMTILPYRVLNSLKGRLITVRTDSQTVDTMLATGSYSMFTYSKDNALFNFADVVNVEKNSPAKKWNYNGLNVTYANTVSQNSVVGSNWYDNNPYTGFVESGDNYPLLIDSVCPVDIKKGVENNIVFKPSNALQKINITFNIKKSKDSRDNNANIDAVYAEISGVPSKFNFFTKEVDFSKTYKVIKKAEMQQSNDSIITCNATFYVTGLVYGKQGNLSGPGFLQVIVKGNGHMVSSYPLSLHNYIKSANLLSYSSKANRAYQNKKEGSLDLLNANDSNKYPNFTYNVTSSGTFLIKH